jgi:branched-chain amino acid transport system ATP-binding protein
VNARPVPVLESSVNHLPLGHDNGAVALRLQGVRAGYGTIEVLHGVELDVRYGSIFALLGPNGGGKSTMLRTVAGLLTITSGEIFIAGRRTNGVAPDALARNGVCLIPEGRGIFPNLSVRENLWMASHCGRSQAEIEHAAVIRFPRLLDRPRQLAGSLSGGQQQMLAMARALTTDPALLLLDELSMGLAPMVVRQLYEIVAELPEHGVTVVVVEQFARSVLGIADRVAVMTRGRVTHCGTPDEIAEQLATAYLGG